MGMLKFKYPPLPLPTKEYNEGQQDQFQRALRTYFSQIDSAYWDGSKVVNPYGNLVSNVDQANAGVTTANLITYDSTQTVLKGVSVVDNTKIVVAYPGVYLVTTSLQVTNRGNTDAEFEVWFKDGGGIDYPESNTRFDIPRRKSTTVWSHVVPAVTGLFTITDPTTEYIQVAWWASSTDVYLEHYPANTSPTRPEIPSVILTINLVSALT